MKVEDYVGKFSRILEMLDSRNWGKNFDKAEVAIAILHEVAKDRRMKLMSERSTSEEELATEKQMRFMGDLGIDFDEGITKSEASREIEKALNSKT
ncbi:hypothetical protein AKJ48_03550 [candidate division MSBL1 archaeon SCGC-AAA261O19]|uniref:Uncharacterized protein n=3 Tax=candidate division MSBL1 TaxID=215777 RepID=A0A133V055_9EURY|nr:hypothetical protein AKJ42_02450 [candidate division MSBL1 archaeon SCGC-AAA261C02]KXB03953.1 hypothetical protein AKJ48_03550 [candidate division MSBL1 archaeon SCGC-AAA261O19]KXB09493.1 hypothetical protein AKJ46_00170 [candidate division MSBL1 archaeon SCGC-AAA833K04]